MEKPQFLNKKKILCFIGALILSLVFPFYSRAGDIKLYEWGFNIDGFNVNTDIHKSIISPTGEYIILINNVLASGQKGLYMDTLIYLVDLRGHVINRFIVKGYMHSVAISPSGDYIVIATMNDIPEGNPTKGKIHCYDKIGNKKWEKNIIGKPYLSRNVIAISEYKENITDPVTEEDSWTPSLVSFLNYQGKEIFKTAKATKLAAISQDGNYFVTSYQGNTNLYHISGKTLWNQDIEGYVSLSQDGSLICIGERKIDKEHTSREQRIKCLTKEGKTIWTDKMKTRYGVKIVMSLTGDYLLAYPSGIRPFEAGAYYSDKKEVVVYGNRGKQLWKFDEPVKNMGSFKQVLVLKNGSVAILSEEFLTEKGSVKKNDWVYFFNNKGEMLWKTNKIGREISLSDDGKYLVSGPYFYDTQG
jgi:hypothetical protein